MTRRVRGGAGALAALLWLAAGPSGAVEPPLPLPDWLTVDLALRTLPEVDRPGLAVATVRCLLGPVQDLRYAFEIPAGVKGDGPKEGTVRLGAGQSRRISLGLKASGSVVGGGLLVTVIGRVPRSALEEAVRARFAGDRAQVEAGLRLVGALADEATARSIAGFSVTEREAWRADEGPVAGRVLSPAGSPEVALLVVETQPGATAVALESRMRQLETTLRILARPGAGGREDVISDMRHDTGLDLIRSRIQLGIERAAAGRAREAVSLLEGVEGKVRKATASRELAGLAEVGRLALGVASALAGDTVRANDAFDRLLSDPAARARVRAYAAFDRAELSRLAGRPGRTLYERALGLVPSFTLARRRARER